MHPCQLEQGCSVTNLVGKTGCKVHTPPTCAVRRGLSSWPRASVVQALHCSGYPILESAVIVAEPESLCPDSMIRDNVFGVCPSPVTMPG